MCIHFIHLPEMILLCVPAINYSLKKKTKKRLLVGVGVVEVCLQVATKQAFNVGL